MKKKKQKFIGEYVIIRTYSAGVHCGTLKSREGKEAILKNARRLWSWTGAFTLSSVANNGVKTAKMPEAVKKILLTECIEVIPCTLKAEKQLKSMEVHNE